MFSSIRDPLNSARDQAKELLERGGYKPKVFAWNNLLAFFSNIPVVMKLLGEEPEILLFVVFQWIVICLAYVAWTQMLRWIPDGIWTAAREASSHNEKGSFDLINLVLLGWSFFIVFLASYPIGLCNAAMVAVHDLRTCGEQVTIAKCLVIADRHLGRIWMFTALDGWITVSAILDRLPKKHYHRTALDELLYYAWKVGTIGVVPALVNGRDFMSAGRDSVKLLSEETSRALGLRLGYSAVCWVVGVLSYVGAIIIYAKFGDRGEGPNYIYHFYILATVPILVSVGIVSVLVRPFYLLGVAKFYTDVIDVRCELEQDIASLFSWEKSLFSWKTGLFLLMLGVLLIAIFFGDQLGLTRWIDELAQKDLAHFYQR
jgi:hypothetical protein